MNTKQRLLIVGGILVLIIIAIIATVLSPKKDEGNEVRNQEVSTADPIDIALDFYNPWLDAVKSTSTTPYAMALADNPLLSAELRERIKGTENKGEADIDPVLCQTTVPERVTGRIVSQQESEIRVLIMARDKTLTAQSVLKLKAHNDGWYIEDIECAPGEFDIPREFTFEQEGFLLKSVPPPLNPEFWHIVFERDGTLGHTVPLIFSAESSCVDTDNQTSTCAPDQFTEASKARIYGQMTESGATVTRLEFIE